MSGTHEAIKAMYNAFCDYLFERAVAGDELVREEDEDLPPLFEDEIAEILDEHKGEQIQIHFRPEGPLNYRYHCYEKDKSIVFTIYDALENHCLVTVGGANIVDL